MNCSVLDCDTKAKSRGMCIKHYTRWRNHGDVSITKRAPDGAGHTNKLGYRVIATPEGQAYEHIVIAERAVGKKLPAEAEVHHVDENKSNNAHTNLVVCPDRAYHTLLHRRQRALEACGNANWRKCSVCKSYDDPTRMYIHGKLSFHRKCKNQQNRSHACA